MHNLTVMIKYKNMLWIVLLCATVVAFSGLTWIPIDTHEAFVLLSAQHMLDSGDWVIPFSNGLPRLTKPPLNYWLSAMVSLLSGSSHIQPWHGRLPSALAGIGLVLLTAVSGRKLFDERVGILAAAITASCSGYFYYTHSARPEMLYSLLCALAIVAYIHARESTKGKTVATYTMWVAFGAATLCKGPQFPVILLLVFAIDQYWSGNNLRQVRDVLKPVGGLILMALISLPWWLLLHNRLGGEGLSGTQLSGTLINITLTNIVPYYFYRSLQLLLPWIIFLPALAMLGKHFDQRNIKLLALLVLVPAIILTFGPQKRWYYILPAMMPMSLMLAAGILLWCEKKLPGRRAFVGLAGFAIVCVLVFTLAGFTKSMWPNERFSRLQLALMMNQNNTSNIPIVAWGVSPEVYAFYTGKIISNVSGPSEIVNTIEKAPQGKIFLLLKNKFLEILPLNIKTEVLGKSVGDDEQSILVIAWRSPIQN